MGMGNIRKALSPRRRVMRFLDLDWDTLRIARMVAPGNSPIAVRLGPDVEATLLSRTIAAWEAVPAPTAARDHSLEEYKYLAAAFDRVQRSFWTEAPRVCELGCGIGHFVRTLLDHQRHVFAIDVTSGSIQSARALAPDAAFLKLRSLDQLLAVPEADLLYSVRCLQYNTPAIQLAMLRRLLPRVRPGGYAYFQTVTSINGYHFLDYDYLGQAPLKAEVDIHALPQRQVFELLSVAGFDVLEVVEDHRAASHSMASHTFFAQRR